MRIRMLKTKDGAPEGTVVHTFKEGSEHDLRHSPRAQDLAMVFVREGWAVEVGSAAADLKAVATDTKAFDDAEPAQPAPEAPTEAATEESKKSGKRK